MSENAIIVRAGRNSTHLRWLEGAVPNFDLYVIAYEDIPARLRQGAIMHMLVPGAKVAGWNQFFSNRPEVLDRYERIALIDDDIECDAVALNGCFDIGRDMNLNLWQPSLTIESYFSYAVTITNPAFAMRYSSFVEMMCPFFKSSFLQNVLPLFSAGYETGVDRLWSVCCPDPENTCAIIDDIRVRHGRPVGENKAAQGFVGMAATYEDVLDEVHATSGVEHRTPLTFSAVTNRHKTVHGRLILSVFSLAPLLRLSRMTGPKPLRKFASLTKANLRNHHNLRESASEITRRLSLARNRQNRGTA